MFNEWICLVKCFLLLQSFLYLERHVEGKQFDCQYNSREFQIHLNEQIFAEELNSTFSQGVEQVMRSLKKIEENDSSLKLQIVDSSLNIFQMKLIRYSPMNPMNLRQSIRMKSREKKLNGALDFVLKFSNVEPILSCFHLKISDQYRDVSEEKVELDLHAINGKIMSKTAMSYTINADDFIGQDENRTIDLSQVFPNLSKQISLNKKESIIVQSLKSGVQLTAEIPFRLHGEKLKGVITYLNIQGKVKTEFSFRLKGTDFNEEFLFAAQEFARLLSLESSIVSSIDDCSMIEE
jgi:hypothetical protein